MVKKWNELFKQVNGRKYVGEIFPRKPKAVCSHMILDELYGMNSIYIQMSSVKAI